MKIENFKLKIFSASHEKYFLILILLVATFLRFYNLMHDSPHFFNPDERNMAGAITRFRLPAKLSDIPTCIISEFNTFNREPRGEEKEGYICSLNPHFFAYGQFPLYLTFASNLVTRAALAKLQGQPLQNPLQSDFPSAIFWLRFYSALASTLTVWLVYFITKIIINNNYQLKFSIFNFQFSILAALLAAFSPGLIQSAHFGTTESLLTFFFMASIYLSLGYLRNLSSSKGRSHPEDDESLTQAFGRHLKFLFFSSFIIGLALGSKLTGIFFIVPPILAVLIRSNNLIRNRGKNWVFGLLGYCLPAGKAGIIGLFLFLGSIIFFILSSPYNFVEFRNFLSAVFGYEADVATGSFQAFYTRQFIDTTPILYQAEKIFPYALGWPLYILGTLGLLSMVISLLINKILLILSKIKNFLPKADQPLAEKLKIKNYSEKYKIFHFDLSFYILLFAFLTYLIPNSFLFVKWTRFMTPVLPFFAVFSGFTIHIVNNLINNFVVKMENGKWKMENDNKTFKIFLHSCIYAFSILALLPGLAFMSIYTHEDSRVQASYWIYKNIPNNSYILFDTGNVIDIPLGIKNLGEGKNYQQVSFDFYHMDENPKLFDDLISHLEKTNYVFIPSRRIFKNHLRFPKRFPLTSKYYQLLFSGRLGFEKVAGFNSYPRIGPFIFPDEDAEETFTVFDHPVIRIYQKVRPLTKDDYRSLFVNR